MAPLLALSALALAALPLAANAHGARDRLAATADAPFKLAADRLHQDYGAERRRTMAGERVASFNRLVPLIPDAQLAQKTDRSLS